MRHIENLELMFTEHRIDGKDEMLILYFLARLKEEFDLLRMSEGQELMDLEKVLRILRRKSTT